MYRYQEESVLAYRRLTEGTVDQNSHEIGLHNHEPLIVAMDAMIRYVKAYKRRFDTPGLKGEFPLGNNWLEVVKGIRGLCNSDGAVAMERDSTQDSKCNGAIEEMFWKALDIAGFSEEDV